MADDTSKKNAPPGWYAGGIEHIWLPYAQMKTASPPLPVARTQGSRIVLADGRELIDGVRIVVDGVPWLQPSAYQAGDRAPARRDAACDVRRAGA